MKMIKPLAVAAFASTALFGCASSDTTADTTTMSETQTMAGTTADMDDAESVVVEREVAVPVATITLATLSLTNTEDVSDMFENIDDSEKYNLIELAKMSPNLSTFTQLAEAAGISDDLMRDGDFTLFAPTNEAFSKLSKEDLEMLLLPENKAKLAAVLQTHVLPSKVSSTMFNNSQRITLANNRYIPVSVDNNVISLGGATVQVSNVEASNGYIHVVDSVIIPSQDAIDK
ncbi:putative surface protein with fasciclin (FAS1) repeats [Pontibacter aydingkolensis]|uniref:Fasciclin domain-containing protein n=1 Tax=Pontibacter aydingkolensis TaxID=1911536 RepID=A0ABS7CRA8_9BACT|nr:fasciclin domain-containing protein [Pontibacter aydingkolensis]MBW7466382.1 fasciclin domain-containing protein [Pontibacter aydingkolensis]